MKFFLLTLLILNSQVFAADKTAAEVECKGKNVKETLPLSEKNLENLEAADFRAPMSIVNTTENTKKINGKWVSSMGPLSESLACDNTVPDRRYHQGEYMFWHVAPSDTTKILGVNKCAKNATGEPKCSENWSLCGRKIRITCLDSRFCANMEKDSLLKRINDKAGIANNYIPEFFVEEMTKKFGANPKIPKSIVLYITDFCPAEHSKNKKNGTCQGPQVDMSTSAFLMMGKVNHENFIDSNTPVSMEMLAPGDTTPAGPEF